MKFNVNAWDLNTVEEAPRGCEVNIQQLQVIDELTGLANYHGLSATVESEIKRSKRNGRDFAVLAFDLNGMKDINHSHGRLAGDRALCRLAHIFRFSCRLIDFAARYGDDKFVVILPESGAEAAYKVQRRICERLSVDPEAPLLSVSAGFAVYPEGGKTLDLLFESAVRALNETKEQAEGSLTHSGSLPLAISKQKRVLAPTVTDSLTYANVGRMPNER